MQLSRFFIAFSVVCPLLLTAQTWRTTYGAFYDENCVAVRTVGESDFIAVGTTGSFGAGNSDIYLLKVNGSGDPIWTKTIGQSGIEQARDLKVIPNEGYIIVGTVSQGDGSGYNGYLLRLDSEGNTVWQKTIGGTDWDFFNEVQVVEGGGFLIVGQTYSEGEIGGNAWLVRTDDTGEIIWQETIGGSGDHNGLSAKYSEDGEIVMCGSLVGIDGDLDGFISKFSGDGDFQWLETYGGDSLDVARDIVVCSDGGYSVVGATESYSQYTEAWHLKVDEQGQEEWFKHWGQINDQESFEHYQLPDDSYVTIGYTKTTGGGAKDMFLLKSNATGEFVFGRTFGGFVDDEGMSLDITSDGFICGGYSKSYGSGSADVFLIRTDINGFTESEEVGSFFDSLSNSENEGLSELMIYPNPTNGDLNLLVNKMITGMQVVSLDGRILSVMQNLPTGKHLIHLDLIPGMYIANIEFVDGSTNSVKVLVQP